MGPRTITFRQLARWYMMAATGWLVVAVIIGVLLRYSLSIGSLEGFPVANWRHAHSHIAFLGWIFNALVGLSFWLFPVNTGVGQQIRWFWLAQLSVLGMAIFYPIQGYAAGSIAFSTLHIVASIGIGWRLFTLPVAAHIPAQAQARSIMRWALVAMVISALGPVVLGPLAALGYKETIWYRLAIYWYLHFQYNGWFILQMLALWLIHRVQNGAHMPLRGIPLLVIGVMLTYAQSTLWATDAWWVYVVAFAGGACQIIGLVQVGWAVRKSWAMSATTAWSSRVLALVAVGLGLKVVLQFWQVFPGCNALAEVHGVVIAFLHLVFLGVVTPFIWAMIVSTGMVRLQSMWNSAAFGLFLGGFILMELGLILPVLWGQVPALLPAWLFYTTLIMAVGIAAGMVRLQQKLLQGAL